MKVTLNWLKEYVDITEPVDVIAEKLTMAGLEVAEIINTAESWDNVVVAQIKGINPHPNADRLTLPTVDLGGSETMVVCGAPNLQIGAKVAFASVGAQLIDPHTGKVETLKAAKIRGVESAGMVCSERELGISDSHEGVLILPDDAPVGTPLADYLGDVILDVEVTPNRPDCLSVTGIAREIAAQTGKKADIREAEYPESGGIIEGRVTIEIEAPDLCPRYSASLITGVSIGESPLWMQQRLLACGMRPINNVVDITNYVMLEYGQPLHSFDYERISGKKIIVRRAAEGEKFETLDGSARTLTNRMLVIADGARSVAVAGVMGGANSEVTENTTSILLEAASFNAASIHYTGRGLGIGSEACMRFERGISPGLTMPALKRATQLFIELCGGEAARGVIDVYPGKKEAEHIPISTGEVKRILGIDLTLRRIEECLKALGFTCSRSRTEGELLATAPYWRSDIHITEDLIEEVARIIGYDKLPTTMLSQPIPAQHRRPMDELKAAANRLLTGMGFQEIQSFSLTSLDLLEKLSADSGEISPAPMRVKKPMSMEQEYLRPTLRASLLTALASNQRHREGAIRLFEVDKTYHRKENDLPDEVDMLCAVLGGTGDARRWQGEERPLDFAEAKGVADTLLERLGVTASYVTGSDSTLQADNQAVVTVGGKPIGVLGEIHPAVLERFDIEPPAYLIELDLPALLPHTGGHRMYQPVPRFPAVFRDLALVVDAGVTYQQVMDILKGFSLMSEVSLFDIYSGAQVPPGKKSLAFRLTFQSEDHTLTDKEVDWVEQQMLRKLANELGAERRS